MREKDRGWLTLVAAAMVAYGVAVVWGQVWQLRVVTGFKIEWSALVPAVLIGLVGIAAFTQEMLREPDDHRPHLLAQPMGLFVLAWRRLWSTKWLLWVYGSVAGLAVADAIVQHAITAHYLPQKYQHGNTFHSPIDSIAVLRGLTALVRGTYAAFIPAFRTSYEPLFAVVVLLLGAWVLLRVIRLSRQQECDGKRGFYALCVVVAVLSCWAMSLYWANTLRSVVHIDAPRAESPYFLVYATLAALAATAIVSAMLFGGVIGMLARSRSEDDLGGRSLLVSSVVFFSPMVAFYLLYGVATTLQYVPDLVLSAISYPRPSWPISPAVSQIREILGLVIPTLLLLVMFAPFGIAARGMGAVQSMRHSFGIWKRMWQEAGLLVVLGSFVSVIGKLPRGTQLLGVPKWVIYMSGYISLPIVVAAGALIFLAVWEFYSANALEPEHVLEEGA